MLSAELADPFGDDTVDFLVTEWLREMVELTGELVEYLCPYKMIGRSLEEAAGQQGPLPGLVEKCGRQLRYDLFPLKLA